ncbi:MAG: cytochrome c biogenesis protein CcsA [Gammaproteobacteria bacterium]
MNAEFAIQLHIALSLLGAGLLTLAAAQAVTLALQDALLHGKSPRRLVQALPPLQTMERWLFLLIALGFVMLSLSLLSGLLFIEGLTTRYLAHTVLSVAAWAVFGTLLWGRWRRGWRGRTALHWTLLGYGLLILVLAYFGSKLVIDEFVL